MFYSGQKVVCVDASGTNFTPVTHSFYHDDNEPLTEGSVYTIFWCGMHSDDCSGGEAVLSVTLHEINREPCGVCHKEVPYAASRFRPLVTKKTDIGVFTSILNSARMPETV